MLYVKNQNFTRHWAFPWPGKKYCRCWYFSKTCTVVQNPVESCRIFPRVSLAQPSRIQITPWESWLSLYNPAVSSHHSFFSHRNVNRAFFNKSFLIVVPSGGRMCLEEGKKVTVFMYLPESGCVYEEKNRCLPEIGCAYCRTFRKKLDVFRKWAIARLQRVCQDLKKRRLILPGGRPWGRFSTVSVFIVSWRSSL